MQIINALHVFTDGSVNQNLNFGYGAYFTVTESEIETGNPELQVRTRRFDDTSSVKLELQTLLWALSEIADFDGKIILYTDSQNITSLPERRTRLEKNDFLSKKNNHLNNSELYKQFFGLSDTLNIEIIKVEGHKKSGLKNEIDRLFTIVDRAARKAVREEKSLE
jgi:ribonuclease HI